MTFLFIGVRFGNHKSYANPNSIASLRDFWHPGANVFFYLYLIPNGIVPQGQNIGRMEVRK